MTTITATRRSPRTIEKFCNKHIVAESVSLTATLFSIATCAGWSADRIAITIERYFHVRIPAEVIWDIHAHWIHTRKPFNYDDRVTMGWMMGQIGLHVYEMGRPLNMTPRPISIVFQPTWSPKVCSLSFTPSSLPLLLNRYVGGGEFSVRVTRLI